MKAVLVLGGGGAKSLAHAGASKAIREAGWEVTHIVGTSMGAVIGAALAAGSSAEHIAATARSLNPKDIASRDLFALMKGVFASHVLKAGALKRTIARFVPVTRFAQLQIPLTVTATDLDSGELVLFGTQAGETPGPLLDALYASCALPLYFPPLRIGGRRLADGGLRAVLPLGVAAAIPADVVVAVHVGPGFDEVLPPATARSRPIPAMIRAHGEAIRIMMAAQTETGIEDWHGLRLIYVRPVAEREATFAVGQTDRYFQMGYEATRRALDGRTLR